MNWRIRLTWWDKTLLAIMAVAAVIAFVRFATGIGTIANINNAYPWGWWVGYGIMTMIAIGGVGFTITALVEIFGVHRYHSFVRPAVLMALLCYASAITMLMVELGRPWMVWMVLVSWAPTSALYEVGWCAFLYLTVLALEFAQVPLEQAGWGRTFRIVRAIYIPIMLLGVTLSHLHQSSLGTLMALIPHKINLLWWSDLLPLLFLFSAMMAGPAMAILEHLAAARWLGFVPRMDLLAGLARIEAWLVGLFLAFQMGDLFYRGAADAMFTASWFAVSFWVEIGFGLMLPFVLLLMPEVRESRRGLATACSLDHCGRITAPAERGRDRFARAALGKLLPFIRRGWDHARHYGSGLVCVRLVGAHPSDPRRVAVAARQACVLQLDRPAYCTAQKEYPEMTTERSPRFPAFRIVVMLVVLVNLILTIAIITQVRELQQRVASLPPDLASKRDVAMLRPLRVREILTQNCVECHSTRRLGVTVSMEPAEIQRTVERMQSHPGANISPG